MRHVPIPKEYVRIPIVDEDFRELVDDFLLEAEPEDSIVENVLGDGSKWRVVKISDLTKLLEPVISKFGNRQQVLEAVTTYLDYKWSLGTPLQVRGEEAVGGLLMVYVPHALFYGEGIRRARKAQKGC